MVSENEHNQLDSFDSIVSGVDIAVQLSPQERTQLIDEAMKRHAYEQRESGMTQRFIDAVHSGELNSTQPVLEEMSFSSDQGETSKIYYTQPDGDKGTIFVPVAMRVGDGEYTRVDDMFTNEDVLLAVRQIGEIKNIQQS